MSEQAVQQRRRQGLDIAEVALYSALLLLVLFLSVCIPA